MTAKKQQLKLMDSLICRTPIFSIKDEINICWPELKRLIKEASPEFYGVIADLKADQLESTNEKTVFSIWKYFNRSRFRSTPFGNFAAVSFVEAAAKDNGPDKLRISSKMTSYEFADWSTKDDHAQNAKKMVQASAWFQSNSTYYIVGDQLRYIRNTDGQFELATVMIFSELERMLSVCRTRQNKQAIYEFMASEYEMQPRAVDSLLCQLIECQLLLTELMPNITGEDYFERIHLPQKNSITKYIIAERDINGGQPDIKPLNKIAGYIEFIKDFIPETKNVHLDTFKKEFTRKFDLQAIPLSIALDPETGIGYGDMAQVPQESLLGGVFANLQQKQNAAKSLNYTAKHSFLLNALMKDDVIRLEKFGGDDVVNANLLPNTLSAMFHYWQGMPVLQTVGGCTANSLLGRFSLACDKAEMLAKEIVNKEESANPQVTFFDIAYQSEKRVDNVNRRKHIYNYELPILTWSCNVSALLMDDIWVMIRGGEVVLWSNQYNKRLVPRIATAYNYNRSDLAIYRFLCDLQHQGIQSDLNFNIKQLFPGLDHYPRVVYKDVVVAATMWRIELKDLLSTNKDQSVLQLKKWLDRHNITTHFKCGSGDRMLCFDPENMKDLAAFVTYCRQNNEKELYIEEALIDDSSMIEDENGKPYLPQYIANYFHEQPVCRDLHSYTYPPETREAASGTFLPGSEWLYFEIYCHPLRANDILDQYIAPIINTHKKQLQNWFFIRYSDPKPHIRLRLKVKHKAFINDIICSIKPALEPLYGNGLITDIQLKTYHQEIERYGAQRMDKVESFFHYDSKYALRVLSQTYSDNQVYHLTLKLMSRLFALAFKDIDQRINVIKAIADSFSNEFSISNDDYKAINKSFESFRTDKSIYALPASETFLKQYDNAFNHLIDTCSRKEKINIVADLVHMHINRVFFTDQRMHEAILYQYLQKQVKAQKHLAVVEPAH